KDSMFKETDLSELELDGVDYDQLENEALEYFDSQPNLQFNKENLTESYYSCNKTALREINDVNIRNLVEPPSKKRKNVVTDMGSKMVYPKLHSLVSTKNTYKSNIYIYLNDITNLINTMHNSPTKVAHEIIIENIFNLCELLINEMNNIFYHNRSSITNNGEILVEFAREYINFCSSNDKIHETSLNLILFVTQLKPNSFKYLS
ncbi:hypothetical protein MXB_1025, partial [Myxobolus squamalis]